MALAWKLLILIAVVLMPLAMRAAPASASVHHQGASMPMQRCPEQGSRHESKGSFAECTMACASALPAADREQEQRIAFTASIMTEVPTKALHGLQPETATPPPKGA